MKNKILFVILIIFLINFFGKGKDDIENNNYSRPKISIFLPIYNKAKYLKRSITSIQKQSLKEIEIIPVNDCSTDNSLEILKDFAKKDSRIKIINNKKNYGLCFSRVMGILNSKGEYLMNLDPDDEYRGKNTLKDLYNLANKLKVDFISFFILSLPDRKKSFQFSNFNQIIQQPKLLESAFWNDHLTDFYITNKLIKRELLEIAVKIFGNKIYEQKWNYHEDNIWSILLHKYANSSVFINKIVYLYYSKNSDSEMYNRGNNLEIKNYLYRNEMYQEIFKTKKEEKYIISGYSELLLILEKNIKIIKENMETKYLCIKHLENYKKKYKLSDEIILKINNLIDIFAL